jgi:hypothetical protein
LLHWSEPTDPHRAAQATSKHTRPTVSKNTSTRDAHGCWYRAHRHRVNQHHELSKHRGDACADFKTRPREVLTIRWGSLKQPHTRTLPQRNASTQKKSAQCGTWRMSEQGSSRARVSARCSERAYGAPGTKVDLVPDGASTRGRPPFTKRTTRFVDIHHLQASRLENTRIRQRPSRVGFLSSNFVWPAKPLASPHSSVKFGHGTEGHRRGRTPMFKLQRHGQVRCVTEEEELHRD